MPSSIAAPWRLTPEALFCIGAAFLAGFVIRARSRTGATSLFDLDDSLAFDDTGIPLRIAALAGAQARVAR